MKTFNRTSLPESISYNGKIHKCDFKASAALSLGGVVSWDAFGLCGKSVVYVKVLSKQVKGKTDLYGQPYKPTTWVFTN